MAHELGKHDTMASGNNITPWHKIGTVVQGLMDAEQATILGGWDFEVMLGESQIVTPDGVAFSGATSNHPYFTYTTIPDADDPNKKLYIPFAGVGNRYVPFQPNDAMDLLMRLVQESDHGFIETIGTLKNKRVMFSTIHIPQHIKIVGEETIPFLLFTSTNDGTGRITVALVLVRVVCMNTLNAALKTAKRVYQ